MLSMTDGVAIADSAEPADDAGCAFVGTDTSPEKHGGGTAPTPANRATAFVRDTRP